MDGTIAVKNNVSKLVIVCMLIFTGIAHTIPCTAIENLTKVQELIQPAVVKVTVYSNDRMGILSGAVVHSSGIILTSFFGDEGEYTVEFTNGLIIPATLIARDDVYQVATLKIDKSNLFALPIAKKKSNSGGKSLCCWLRFFIIFATSKRFCCCGGNHKRRFIRYSRNGN